MKWKWLNFTHKCVSAEFEDFQTSLRGLRCMRTSNGGTHVPVWTLDLWDATIRELDERIGPTYPTKLPGVFRTRVLRCVTVVNKPGGVDPDVFSAALALGGWEAASALHPRLPSMRDT